MLVFSYLTILNVSFMPILDWIQIARTESAIQSCRRKLPWTLLSVSKIVIAILTATHSINQRSAALSQK